MTTWQVYICYDFVFVGVKLKGLLVPIDREEERRLRGRKGSQSSDGLQDDREFSPLRFIDATGDQRELRKYFLFVYIFLCCGD